MTTPEFSPAEHNEVVGAAEQVSNVFALPATTINGRTYGQQNGVSQAEIDATETTGSNLDVRTLWMVQQIIRLRDAVAAIGQAQIAANASAGTAVVNIQAELDRIAAAVSTGQPVVLDATQLASLVAQFKAAFPSYDVTITPKTT